MNPIGKGTHLNPWTEKNRILDIRLNKLKLNQIRKLVIGGNSSWMLKKKKSKNREKLKIGNKFKKIEVGELHWEHNSLNLS